MTDDLSKTHRCPDCPQKVEHTPQQMCPSCGRCEQHCAADTHASMAKIGEKPA